ncbi:TonB-dependent receptor domain-containing protein [Sphingopyxis sp.]|uniref:TonB-dependent receptor domain-containing protein n=1 Tax=Sphingopyxis sp. TaxID=1908224 RepID=UPI002DE7B695|nr:TonB-dependent receptor [Sphingopyxis sp.]
MKKTQYSKLKLGAAPLVMSVALVSAPAFAQDAPAEDTASSAEIVVTGTLIRNPNLESSSPVAVIGADEVALRQTNNAEQLLRELPGVTPNLGGNVNNGTVGSARVDLRGLGANRNIVLLDSQRLAPSSFSGIVDLNNIPVALIERVDVLTGGASTSYGADAVSGVVNFVTKQDFAGLDATISEQISERGDTNVFRADLVLGANFDDGRGNAVLAVSYQEADPLYFGARPFGEFTISSATGVSSGDSFTSSPTGISTATDDFQISPDGSSLVPFYNAFNFNPFNVYTTPFERFSFYGKARYEVSDKLEVYARGLFSKNRVSSIIAASGIFGTAGLTVPGQNPYLNATIRNQLCGFAGIALGPTCDNNPAIPLQTVYRRSVELGPRISEYVTTFFDYTAGLKYSFNDSLKLDVYGSYGESENAETRTGYVANSRVQQALNATNTTTCQNTTNGCVPLNLFGPQGSITPEMGAFIGGISSTIVNRTSLAQVHGVLSGDFGGATLPWASEPVSFAVGGEYRNYTAQRAPDNLASIPGELGGAGGAILPLNGGFDVKEAFGELIVPLVSDKPFFDELTFEAGVRYSKYKIDATGTPKFNATTYKFGLNWSPTDAIKFRGNYQRAVRAPNIGELFAPVSTGLTNLLIDPCAGAAPTTNANLAAVCIAQGAPVASIGAIQNPSAGQANSTGGGNPNLRPEKSDSYSVGVVLRPQDLISGLTITLDYYNIKVKDAITAATPGDVIAACFGNITAASAADPACTSIRRNAINGRLSGTSTVANPIPGLPTPLTNNGQLKTDGIDLTVNYRTDLGFAELQLNFAGNYTFNSSFKASPSAVERECTGFYSTNCGISNGLTVGSLQPEFQWTQRTTLAFDKIDLSLLWRHIDGMQYEPGLPPLFSGTITGKGELVGRQVNFNRIKAYDYFDLTARFAFSDNVDLTLSAFNLFDKQPPIVGSSAGSTTFNGGNTYPSTYDTIGRRYAASVHFKF